MRYFNYISFILLSVVLFATAQHPEGINPLRTNDIGIQHPDDIPEAGNVDWREPLPGFFYALVDVMFHNQLVDRIMFLRIDPVRYSFDVHCNKDLLFIDEWLDTLKVVAVINGSYYQRDPNYGEPYMPMILNGVRRGAKPYTSSHGAILFEPVDPDSPRVKVIDYKGGKLADIENQGYKGGTTSYPTLVDFEGRVRAKRNPKWRASRSFIGLDETGYLILGNTQSGFFSLRRLGLFLKSLKDPKFSYALNLDGGPPACMAVKAGTTEYWQFGVWESNNISGEEVLYWNDKNYKEWAIPIVISVNTRE